MRTKHTLLLIAVAGIVTMATPALGQNPAMPMMGMRHDSTTMAEMAIVHELIRNHDRITRTVTNLPDGIRTVTESTDSSLAKLIRQHVEAMTTRVASRDDPGLPMESSALRAIYRSGTSVRTTIDTTARGAIVVQTSTDSATVVALQQHATEVTDLVRRGMAAMHDGMMRMRDQMMPAKLPGTRP